MIDDVSGYSLRRASTRAGSCSLSRLNEMQCCMQPRKSATVLVGESKMMRSGVKPADRESSNSPGEATSAPMPLVSSLMRTDRRAFAMTANV